MTTAEKGIPLKQRVAITGIGLVTPLGLDREATWRGLIGGKSGAGIIASFDAQDWPVHVACEVKGFELRDDAVSKERRVWLNRAGEFVAEAARAAMDSAPPIEAANAARFGVMTGSGIGCLSPQAILELLRDFDLNPRLAGLARYLERAVRVAPWFGGAQHPGAISALLAERWGARAPWESHATACSAGAQAILAGMRRIRSGEIDYALCGGGDSVAGELLLAGFSLLGVMSQRSEAPERASRPFDKERDGLVAGEGAAMLLLERMDLALERGAPIYAELIGGAVTENAYRITDLPPDGAGAIAAMQGAMADARISPEAVGYINAHGTSTPQNDRVEAQAIWDTFNAKGARPLVSSTKAQTGHFIAAAGAVEAAFSALSIFSGVLPASVNLEESDCAPINFVGTTAIRKQTGFVLSNSFGFGGTNVCLAFCNPDDHSRLGGIDA